MPSATLFTKPDDFIAGDVSGGQLLADFVAVGATPVRVGDGSGLRVAVTPRSGVADGAPTRGSVALGAEPGLTVIGDGSRDVLTVGAGVLTGVSKSCARANLVGASVGCGIVASFASEQASAASTRITHASIARRLNSLTFISIQSRERTPFRSQETQRTFRERFGERSLH